VKNGLFITEINLNEKNTPSGGVIKKILGQIDTLNIEGQLSCKSLILPRPKYNRVFLFFVLLFFDVYKGMVNDSGLYDFIYIRRIFPLNYGFLKLLKTIKRKNAKCKILYEIPTYPYDKEYRSFTLKVNLFIDRLFRVKLRNYIDKIVTFTNDEVIFGIPTIKIQNGIQCADIQVRTPGIAAQNISIIAAAAFSFWHGYDRLIEGLNSYYKTEADKKVYLHFVGDGPSLNLHKKKVQEYNLSEYVFFYGFLSGEKLTEIFNRVDLGACSLGGHRKGYHLSSELKSREYLARGLPMISSVKIDILPPDFEYCLYVPGDDSPIDIKSVIQFYENITGLKSIPELTHEIRQFAEANCDMSKTMRPVIDYFTQ